MNLDVTNLHLMKPYSQIKALLPAALAVSLACAVPALAQSTTPAPDNAPFDVAQLFATTCGWCHSDGGRAAGKGPQLMNSPHQGIFGRSPRDLLLNLLTSAIGYPAQSYRGREAT